MLKSSKFQEKGWKKNLEYQWQALVYCTCIQLVKGKYLKSRVVWAQASDFSYVKGMVFAENCGTHVGADFLQYFQLLTFTRKSKCLIWQNFGHFTHFDMSYFAYFGEKRKANPPAFWGCVVGASWLFCWICCFVFYIFISLICTYKQYNLGHCF